MRHIKEERKEEIKQEIKQNQEIIKFNREIIDRLKKELDFINGNYDKTWEEEYGN